MISERITGGSDRNAHILDLVCLNNGDLHSSGDRRVKDEDIVELVSQTMGGVLGAHRGLNGKVGGAALSVSSSA